MRLELSGIKNQSIEYFQENISKKESFENHTQPRNEIELISRDDVKTVASTMNNFVEPLQTNLKFEYHEELNEYYVTVVNPKTNETIREIPPKKMLDMYAAMVGFIGVLVDEKI